MQNLLDGLAALGETTLQPLWLPLIVWTALCLPVFLAMEYWRAGHPLFKYQTCLALLFALPAGLVLAGVTDFSLLSLLKERAAAAPSGGMDSFILYLEPQSAASVAPGYTLMHAVGLLSVAGLLLMAFRTAQLAVRWHGLRRLKRGLTPLRHPQIEAQAAEVATSLGLRRRVHILMARDPLVPMTFGLFRPAVVVPAAMMDDPGSLDMALRHEMVHVRRYDDALQWIEQVLGAVFFMHPLAALLRRRIAYYREVTCDLEVLSRSPVRPKEYALLLYSFLSPPARTTALSLSMAVTPKQLTKRIAAMKLTRAPLTSRMRRTGLLAAAALLLITTTVVACADIVGMQDPEPAPLVVADAIEPEIFIIVEEMPVLIGGISALAEQIRYPENAKNAGVEGRVLIQFVVTEDGSISDEVVLRGVGSGLDEEALRVVRESKWEPGKQRGKPVKVKLSIPIAFRLDGAAEIPGNGVAIDEKRLTLTELSRTEDRITGRITDAETGRSLAGANVVIEGTRIGASTNAEGRFTILVPLSQPAALKISFIGFYDTVMNLPNTTFTNGPAE